MSYPDWKKVYIDKTMTLDEWKSGLSKAGSNGKIGSEVGGKMTPLQREIKAAEDKAFATKTGADFGFKKMKGSPDWAKELYLVNDPTQGIERRINCQRCVVAHEARMRGYDVMARPSWGKDDPMRTLEGLLSVFGKTNIEIRTRDKSIDDVVKSVESVIRSFGDGARAFVLFNWDKNKSGLNGGHVVVAQCVNNNIINLADPQRKTRAALKLLERSIFDSIKILRVDTLKFTEEVKRCCENRK